MCSFVIIVSTMCLHASVYATIMLFFWADNIQSFSLVERSSFVLICSKILIKVARELLKRWQLVHIRENKKSYTWSQKNTIHSIALSYFKTDLISRRLGLGYFSRQRNHFIVPTLTTNIGIGVFLHTLIIVICRLIILFGPFKNHKSLRVNVFCTLREVSIDWAFVVGFTV